MPATFEASAPRPRTSNGNDDRLLYPRKKKATVVVNGALREYENLYDAVVETGIHRIEVNSVERMYNVMSDVEEYKNECARNNETAAHIGLRAISTEVRERIADVLGTAGIVYRALGDFDTHILVKEASNLPDMAGKETYRLKEVRKETTDLEQESDIRKELKEIKRELEEKGRATPIMLWSFGGMNEENFRTLVNLYRRYGASGAVRIKFKTPALKAEWHARVEAIDYRTGIAAMSGIHQHAPMDAPMVGHDEPAPLPVRLPAQIKTVPPVREEPKAAVPQEAPKPTPAQQMTTILMGLEKTLQALQNGETHAADLATLKFFGDEHVRTLARLASQYRGVLIVNFGPGVEEEWQRRKLELGLTPPRMTRPAVQQVEEEDHVDLAAPILHRNGDSDSGSSLRLGGAPLGKRPVDPFNGRSLDTVTNSSIIRHKKKGDINMTELIKANPELATMLIQRSMEAENGNGNGKNSAPTRVLTPPTGSAALAAAKLEQKMLKPTVVVPEQPKQQNLLGRLWTGFKKTILRQK